MTAPQVSFIFSLTSFILYLPANWLPFMKIQFYGRINSTTIWDGIVSLYQAGSVFIAVIVFTASILVPLLKIILLMYLSFTTNVKGFNSHQNKIYSFIEIIGRWSMLDIFLLAVMVSILKLGKWAEVTAEPGAMLFALVVIFTMISSASLEKLQHCSSGETRESI